MTNILDLVVSYLDFHTTLVAGTSLFYNEMPDEPTQCVALQEERTTQIVPAQIDAEIHQIKVTARDQGNETALALAQSCWRWLFTNDENYEDDKTVDTTGFITLLDGTVIKVDLYGTPVWEKADQQGRKYFCFYAKIISPR